MLARRIILALIPLLIFGGIGGWLWHDRNHPQETAAQETEGSLPVGNGEVILPYDDAPDPDEEAGVEVVEVQEAADTSSDAVEPVEAEQPAAAPATEAEVLQAAAGACKAPLWMQLLAFEKPLRTAVQVIDAIAHGERPLDALPTLRPQQPFSAAPDAADGGRLVIDAAAIGRFQPIALLLESADAKALAALYRQAEPLLQRECQAMGYQDTQVRSLLTDACSTILAIPDFDFEPTLIRRSPGQYAYEDAAFQSLNDAQKLFVRMGHKNCRRLKQLCSDFADELQLYGI